MSSFKERERLLLDALCEKNNINPKLVRAVMKDFVDSSYEEKNKAARNKAIIDLINFYSKKGELNDN